MEVVLWFVHDNLGDGPEMLYLCAMLKLCWSVRLWASRVMGCFEDLVTIKSA